MENLVNDILFELIEEALFYKSNNKTVDDTIILYYEIISKIINKSEVFGLVKILPEKYKTFRPEELLTNHF